MELLKKAYADYLNTLNIHVLRNVARAVGVYKPTGGKKESLIERTIAVLIGAVVPAPPSTRGAPLKEDALDPKYIRELNRIREEYFASTGTSEKYENVMQVRSGEKRSESYDQPLYMGVLEIEPNGCGYLRVSNCQPTAGKDVFVSSQNLRAWVLKEGDYVVGFASKQSENNNPSLIKVLSVNAVMQYQNRRDFDDFSACYPEEKIRLFNNGATISLRYIDLFAPIGKGQRAIVCAPSIAGGNAILKDIACAIERRIDERENLHLLALLIDERPEEVTEFRRSLRLDDSELIYTTFEKTAQDHLRAAKLTFARAKRLAEIGEDVVVLVDSLTRLTRAADLCGTASRMLPCGLDASAFQFPKTCLSLARKLKGGGSITVVATVETDTGDAADEVICNELQKICNCRITLSRALEDKRIYPAIDVKNSYTVREEAMLSELELEGVSLVKGKLLQDNGEALYNLMQQTPDNAALFEKLKTL